MRFSCHSKPIRDLTFCPRLLHVPAGVNAGYCLSSSSSEGAILTLPEGAASLDLYNIAGFRQYAMKNAIAWYQFVNIALGREASNGSLYLVSGCDKSTTWGVASISCASGTDALSLKFAAVQLVEASATREYSWETYCPATVRVGPKVYGDVEHPHNQCVFLRGFKIMVQEGLTARIQGTVKVTSMLDAKISDLIPTKKGRTVPVSVYKKGAGNQKAADNNSRGEGASNDVGPLPSDTKVIVETFPSASEVSIPKTRPPLTFP